MRTTTPDPHAGGLHYTACLVAAARSRFLLWQEGDQHPDRFAVEPGTHRLLVADTLDDLITQAGRWNLAMADKPPARFDIDALLSALDGLHDGRRCSAATSDALLNGWNALEDLARGLGVAMDEGGPAAGNVLSEAYDKVFMGNNLLAPDGAPRYRPRFTPVQRRVMRRYLRGLWRDVLARASAEGTPLVGAG